MALYQKKSGTVEAVQWTGFNFAAIQPWLATQNTSYGLFVPAPSTEMPPSDLRLGDEDTGFSQVPIGGYLVNEGATLTVMSAGEFEAAYQPAES